MSAEDLARIAVTINGETHTFAVDFAMPLCTLLREEVGLTGTKVACEEQRCGACTVLVDNEPVSSCTLLAYEVDGRRVLTIEGLVVGDRLDPVQEAFMDATAMQCGFCTPGMVMMAKWLLSQVAQPDLQQIQDALVGNLCRCTGYGPILEAVRRASGNV